LRFNILGGRGKEKKGGEGGERGGGKKMSRTLYNVVIRTALILRKRKEKGKREKRKEGGDNGKPVVRHFQLFCYV